MDNTSWLIVLIIITFGFAAQEVVKQYRYRLRVMEKKLDLLLAAANLTHDELADIPTEITDLLAKNRYNQAVGRYCKFTGESQSEADRKLRIYLEKHSNSDEQSR